MAHRFMARIFPLDMPKLRLFCSRRLFWFMCQTWLSSVARGCVRACVSAHAPGELGGEESLPLFGMGLTAATLLDVPDSLHARRPRSSSSASTSSSRAAEEDNAVSTSQQSTTV